jgi:hypothetical protein
VELLIEILVQAHPAHSLDVAWPGPKCCPVKQMDSFLLFSQAFSRLFGFRRHLLGQQDGRASHKRVSKQQ